MNTAETSEILEVVNRFLKPSLPGPRGSELCVGPLGEFLMRRARLYDSVEIDELDARPMEIVPGPGDEVLVTMARRERVRLRFRSGFVAEFEQTVNGIRLRRVPQGWRIFETVSDGESVLDSIFINVQVTPRKAWLRIEPLAAEQRDGFVQLYARIQNCSADTVRMYRLLVRNKQRDWSFGLIGKTRITLAPREERLDVLQAHLPYDDRQFVLHIPVWRHRRPPRIVRIDVDLGPNGRQLLPDSDNVTRPDAEKVTEFVSRSPAPDPADAKRAARRRLWRRLAWVIVVAVACGSLFAISNEGRPVSRARREVERLATRLAEEGVECRGLTVTEARELGRESFFTVSRTSPPVPAVAHCRLANVGDDTGSGELVSFHIYNGPEHLHHLPTPDQLIGQAVVYGETWRIWIYPPDHAPEFRRALDAKIIMPKGETLHLEPVRSLACTFAKTRAAPAGSVARRRGRRPA